MRVTFTLFSAALFLFTSIAFSGTTGKISGTVRDAQSGEPLPNANVVIEGTLLGAATNPDGYFAIINVPPGRYKVTAGLIGYKPGSVVNIRVDIDQTTEITINLREEAIAGEEVTVVATRPVVQRDVAASRANIEITDVEKMPVVSVTGAVGLQAGVQGLVIRGGAAEETAFLVNGMMMRDERTNAPYSSVSLLSVQDIQVQTGGFSAEYGNVRSGLINVVTKEGGKSNYSFGAMVRASNAQPKHFGASIYDRNSYWIRPYLDPDVAWKGTTAINPATGQPYWDTYTQKQYPSFEGWNSLAAKNIGTKMELTPEALQRLFLWQYRKQAEVNDADYNIDLTFGGPVPLISEMAGDLRFFAAFQKTQRMYVVPLSDNAWRDYSGSLKLTSDITGSMKLNVEGRIGRTSGTNNNNAGYPGMFQTAEDIGAVMNRVSYIDTRIFATDYWCPSYTDYYSTSAKLTNALSATTYYEASLNMFRAEYHTDPGRLRDTSKIYKFGNSYYVDESPFGFFPEPDPASGLGNIRFGIGFSNTRDTSIVTSYTGKFDITSQLDRYNQLKAGLEFTYTDQNINYGLYDAKLKDNTYQTGYHRFPLKGALYLRDKLEFEGMVADLGVRVDYLNPQGEWYEYDPFTAAFNPLNSGGIDTLLILSPVKKQVLVSPRLGVSFPISEDAKLYFNYGHFYQQPWPDNMYLLRQSGFDASIRRVADPNAKLPRTIAYELGYEHSLAEEFLLRVAGYYKDVSAESLMVGFTSNTKKNTEYLRPMSSGYRDIRGFEISIYKNRGSWVQGFINYTYDVRTNGYFGVSHYFENASEQARYELQNIPQEKPIPRPYARLNLDFFTPHDFGPSVGGFQPLADWRINFVSSWTSGYYFTWANGTTIPGVENNLQWSDNFNTDMRITKDITFGRFNVQLFADVSNLFNFKYMTTYGFVTADDYNTYIRSLHQSRFTEDFETKAGFVNIVGSDHPGMYRKEGVAFQPIEAYRHRADIMALGAPQTRPFYYAVDADQYYQYVNGAWQVVDGGRLQQVLDDKAYIDMPNQETFTFLNPRRIFFGLRLWLEI
jgi:outer membrane receptor protein involved in Fe transport